MAIPKDQKPAEVFRAIPQRKITKEMFLARSFTVKPLELLRPLAAKQRDLIDQFVAGQFDRMNSIIFQPGPLFQPLPLAMPKKQWTLADLMPEKMPQPAPKTFVERNPEAPIYHAPSHTCRIFDPTSLGLIARRIVCICEEEKLEALLCCGHSGLILAGAVSVLCGIPVFAARKHGEQPVAGSQGLKINGIAPHGPVKRWAWLDDHISSGGTFQRSRILARDARLVASAIPTLFILYEGHGTYVMTEDRYIGYELGMSDQRTPSDAVRVRTTKV